MILSVCPARLLVVAWAAVFLGGCAVMRAPRPLPPSPTGLARAERLLAAERIEVEIDWAPGCRPAAGTLEGIRSFLREYAAPPRGVEVWLDEEVTIDGDPMRTLGTHRRPERGGATVTVYLLFVPRFASGEMRSRRGIALPESGAALIAHDTLREESFLTVRGDEIERFVVQHELGHLLGLVSDDRHEHEGHCTDPRCILYAGVDARALLANWWRLFTGRLPDELDPGCRRELQERRAHALPPSLPCC